MKRILIITLEHPPQIGGIASYVHQSACALAKKATVFVYAPVNGNTKEYDASLPYTIIRMKPLAPAYIWPRWLRLLVQIKSIVTQHKIQCIFLHHILPVGYVAWIIKKIYKIPYVIFSHGTDVLLATKKKKKKTTIVASAADAIVFNSKSLQERFLAVLPVFKEKSIIVYPCPDDIFYEYQDLQVIKKIQSQYALEGKKVLISVGRFELGKGFEHIISILPFLLEKIPNIVWILIGSGTQQSQFMKKIQEQKLQNIVRFLGEVPHNDIPPFLAASDAFVLLTHPYNGAEEGIGLVFLEAQAAKIPVIAGKSGGVEEAVLHEQTGLVVDVTTQHGQNVIDAIVRVLTDDAYAETLATNGQNRMRQEFDWNEQLKKLGPWL